MSTVRVRAAAQDRAGGGVPARRAVIRWAWRLFRRQWRQQLLVLALLTAAVAAMTGFVSVGYHVAPPREARFGTADQRIRLEGFDPRKLDADIAAARAWFGTIEVIAHRAAAIPGSVDTVDFRAQDPHGRYGAAMLRLLAGRYPTGAGEVAVTDEVAKTFKLHLGDRLDRDGRDRTVVGLVENPTDLLDEFALVAPGQAGRPDSVTVLLAADPGRFDAFRVSDGRGASMIDTRQLDDQTSAAATILVLATVGLLLVSLVAAAGFAVLAQRRLRQLGMLAAVGATERHLRLVMVANGALVGATAALVGTTVAVLGWLAVAPRLGTIAAHRIDRLDLPWWAIATGMLLAVGSATAAAWWPARSVARIPIVRALSARPPHPKPAHRSAALAGLLAVIGVVCLALADQKRVPLIVAGAAATALGMLFIGPLAIRALAAVGHRSPIGTRLALRDLTRYQARSGAALAAISLTLGIAVTITVSATAATDTDKQGNLAANQLLFRLGEFRLGDEHTTQLPVRSAAQLRSLAARVERYAASLDHATVTALQVAVDPALPVEPGERGGPGGRPLVFLGKVEHDAQGRALSLSTSERPAVPYLATPAVLQRYGIKPSAVGADTDLVTARAGLQRFEVLNAAKGRGLHPNIQTSRDLPSYTSLPTTLITPQAVRRLGWEPAAAGWLVQARQPLTDEQITAARDLAAELGITSETRDQQRSLAQLRTGATATGMLLALGILAMTVGLIRSETAGDLRTLTATGAASRTRRTLTAATTGALALLGAILGTLGAYAALIAWHLDEPGTLSRVPIGYLAAIIGGLPLAATAAGWLLAGRQPPSLARQPLG
jgi:putative ABC transport system permease protein